MRARPPLTRANPTLRGAESMHGACDTIHFKKYTVPGTGCSTDLVPAVRGGAREPALSHAHTLSPPNAPTPVPARSAASPAAQCKNLVQSMSEAILDAMWALWRPHYFRGELPNTVCQVIKRCDKNKNY